MAFLTSAGVTGWERERERERVAVLVGLCCRWCDDPQLVGPSLLNDLHHVIIRYIMVGGLGHKGMFLRLCEYLDHLWRVRCHVMGTSDCSHDITDGGLVRLVGGRIN